MRSIDSTILEDAEQLEPLNGVAERPVYVPSNGLESVWAVSRNSIQSNGVNPESIGTIGSEDIDTIMESERTDATDREHRLADHALDMRYAAGCFWHDTHTL